MILTLDIDAARSLLGLEDLVDAETVETSFLARSHELKRRISAAPTEALTQKYQSALKQLADARDALLAAGRPSVPGLSATQFGDLPSAQPIYTQAGFASSANAAASFLKPGTILAQRYELRARIGLGGMGAVYRAFDANRKEEIAVKVLLPHLLSNLHARERFLTEAKIASSLSHPNIVNVFDVQKDGNTDFLTMELLKGQTLRQMMQARAQARQPYLVEEAIAIARAIGMALAYAHKYTVHRDVKPENIWVDQENSYKLMDFGIARMLTNSQFTQANASLGTAYYMAPEQLKGAAGIDGRADQYSLGILLYELLTGSIPAGRIKPLKQLRKDVPKGFSLAVDRALEPDPTARYADMKDFVSALTGRGSSLLKPILLGLAVAGALAAAAVTLPTWWPIIAGLMPDKSASAKARSGAFEAQGAIALLQQRLQNQERSLDGEVRDAKSALERLDGMVSMERSDAKKVELQRRLTEAKLAFENALAVQLLAQQWIYASDELVRLRSQQNLGETELRTGNIAEAARALAAAKQGIEGMLGKLDDIRKTLNKKSTLQRVSDVFLRLEREDKADLSAANAAMATPLGEASSAEQSGDFALSNAAYQRAGLAAAASLNALAEQLAGRYAKRASQMIKSGDLSGGKRQLARAKELESLAASLGANQTNSATQ